MLPDWLLPSVADVRAEFDGRPRDLFTLTDEDAPSSKVADEAKLDALVNSHIDTQAAQVWGELASESRSMAFPLTLDVLATAYPLLEGARDAEKAAQTEANTAIIENQKVQAKALVKTLVIMKLWYGVSGEDAANKAKNAYITSQTLTGSQKKQIKKIRLSWLSNRIDLDPFY